MSLPDPIERGEARAEAWFHDNVVHGKFQCGCGRLIPIDEGVTMSADPYAPLVCGVCSGADEFMEKAMEKKKDV